jgi:hypothetical protein
MIIQWRRSVLQPLQTPLIDKIINQYETQRAAFLDDKLKDIPELLDTLIRVMEAVVDLSVHELSI